MLAYFGKQVAILPLKTLGLKAVWNGLSAWTLTSKTETA
jgi:hypothetical protein